MHDRLRPGGDGEGLIRHETTPINDKPTR
jgi:hypothetical protein